MAKLIEDFVATLLAHSLSRPQVNKLKASKPLEYYANLAFPPEAMGTLLELITTVTGTQSLEKLTLAVQRNSQKKKPVEGIPGDWLIVRGASQYAPSLYDIDGTNLTDDLDDFETKIRKIFYAGKGVRSILNPFYWAHPSGENGVSFNINGLMAANDAPRLNIGDGATANAFAKFATPAQQSVQVSATPAPALPVASPWTADGRLAGPVAAESHPFAQKIETNKRANLFG